MLGLQIRLIDMGVLTSATLRHNLRIRVHMVQEFGQEQIYRDGKFT
jgi:hypothetical protein